MVVLAGTTAVGKTDVSIPLAELLNAEIVSADSRQVFRELEIGTAKPSREQRERVPHHFIDELSLKDRWTAGDFSRCARERIAAIFDRGRVPLVVGGSMLYLRALLDGFYDEREESHVDYEELRRELTASGLPALYDELGRVDPKLAARTDPHDQHRILRGLAVYRTRHRRLSDLQSQPSEPLPYPFVLFFLRANRSETYDRVNRRVLAMMDAGLIDEVRRLHEQGCDEMNCNALRTHGYQEVFPYLRGQITRERMIESIQKAVRHYVKRQVTWFRHDPRVIWIERDFEESSHDVARRLGAAIPSVGA